jgi:hypothetical protein
MLEQLGEADEDGEVESPLLHAIDKLFQVDRAVRLFGGVGEKIPVGTGGKIALAPTFDLVKIGGVGDGPEVDIQILFHQNGLARRML